MQDKLKYIILILLFTMLCSSTVLGYTGKGTKNNPYVVSAESGLREILTQTDNVSSWIYIAVNDTISITKTITVECGSYRIYAIDDNQTIKRSTKTDVAVNDKDAPKYCIRVKSKGKVVFGYDTSKYKLILNGSMNSFPANRETSGFIDINANAEVTIGKKCLFKNVMNNKQTSYSAPIKTAGNLIVNGEISNCKGINGGAIKATSGTVTINDGAKIQKCISKTEGGAIHCSNGAVIQMNGGIIADCQAGQEGGALFAKGASKCNLIGGEIKNNSAQNSAGGVFSGYGAVLTVGTTSGTGPIISYNVSKGSGGGVRCNGGTGADAGGISYFYGGTIKNNRSEKYGGGIACGNAGADGQSKIIIKNMNIIENSSTSSGGGIWLPEKCKGVSNDVVYVTNCQIKVNETQDYAGGLMVHCNVSATGNVISNNKALGNGGGVCVAAGSIFTTSGGRIESNICSGKGSGLYVNSQFRIMSGAYVNDNNVVYLAKDKYIDVIGRLSKASGLVAKIESEIKSNGTKLVKANYSGTSASKELYYDKTAKDEYTDSLITKKYTCIGINKNQLLRPSEAVNGYENVWIIISEKYIIRFDKNTDDDVGGMPKEQVKFWNENITLSKNKLTRKKYMTVSDKHWNFRKDGLGTCAKPGTVYAYNENRVLYAQWELIEPSRITIHASDRYYVVGQKIVLSREEILKKVYVDDDINSGTSYEIQVIEIRRGNGDLLVEDRDIATQNYMNTDRQEHFIVTLFSQNSKGTVFDKKEMNIYILDTPVNSGVVRFISSDYLYTLNKQSKWSLDFRGQLESSLKKQSGSGGYTIKLSNEKIKEIKANLIEHDYKIKNEMNKALSDNW